jgi:23S rRNA (cytosine1962-C5)-methyltransferase
MPRRRPATDWRRASLRWTDRGWARGGEHASWIVEASSLRLECRPASGGQVGVFPEHAATWGWLDGAVRGLTASLGRPPEVLSLFAYTGGATLACARAGAHVVHVDASKPAVAWARRNAAASGLEDRPVRWLADDVRSVVRRERRRGRSYDGVIVDPPSYGHGASPWKLEADLPPLLDDLAALLGHRPGLVLLSAHTPGYDGDRLAGLCREHLGCAATAGELRLAATSGNVLRLGGWARWAAR